MNIERLTKDELISHTAEIVSSQDNRIDILLQQRQILTILIAITVICAVLS